MRDSGKLFSESDMKRMTPNRVALFIGVMAVVAIVIYLPRYAREQRQVQEALQQQQAAENQAATQEKTRIAAQNAAAATQSAAAERARYIGRFLNAGFARKPGLKNIAVAASTDGEPDRPVATALASRLKDENLVLFTSFFKPSFIADGLFSNVFGGSLESVGRLELTNTLDALLLAQQQVQYSTNGADVNNIITAHTRLEVAFFPLDMMRREQSWTFAANGAGFSPGEAQKNAEERLLKQIAGDTKMSLVPLSQNNQESYP
jgi:cell division protein FtsB